MTDAPAPLPSLRARRIANFRANKRGFVSLILFAFLFFVTIGAEFVANDKPIAGKAPRCIGSGWRGYFFAQAYPFLPRLCRSVIYKSWNFWSS